MTSEPTQQTQLIYPQNVLDKIVEINQKTGIAPDTLKMDYEALFRDPFVQTDPQFHTDEERHRYSVAILWARYVGRAPLQSVQLIPVGVASKRLSKKGSAYASLYVLIKDPQTNQSKLARVGFLGDTTSEIPTISFFCAYTPKLGKYKNSEDLVCDTRTKWESPITLNAKPADILSKISTIRRVPLEKVSSFPTSVDTHGYLDALDWRVVRAIVWRKNEGVRNDGTEWSNYTVGDETTGREATVTKEGKVIPAGFTVWCDKLLHNYNSEDECDFYGTVGLAKTTGQASMNAFQILPIHVRQMETA